MPAWPQPTFLLGCWWGPPSSPPAPRVRADILATSGHPSFPRAYVLRGSIFPGAGRKARGVDFPSGGCRGMGMDFPSGGCRGMGIAAVLSTMALRGYEG